MNTITLAIDRETYRVFYITKRGREKGMSYEVYDIDLMAGEKVHSTISVYISGMSGEDVNAASINWMARTNDYSAKSFADYINSKTHMSGHSAMTEEEYLTANQQ